MHEVKELYLRMRELQGVWLDAMAAWEADEENDELERAEDAVYDEYWHAMWAFCKACERFTGGQVDAKTMRFMLQDQPERVESMMERWAAQKNSYITGLELHELAVAERARFDPEHPKRFRGSQKAQDELVWKIAKDAWQDARDCAKIKPIELARSTE